LWYPFLPLPIDAIKEYFGEKVAYYFAFMDHYNSFLVGPAVIGAAFQAAVFALNDFSGKCRCLCMGIGLKGALLFLT
jgi:hypothetical protein